MPLWKKPDGTMIKSIYKDNEVLLFAHMEKQNKKEEKEEKK